MKSKFIIGSTLVVSVTTLAAAELTGMAEILDGNRVIYAQSDSRDHEDNIEEFLSVAKRIPAREVSTDARSKLNRDVHGREARNVVYDRYLGLGFANNAVNPDRRDQSRIDNCRGDGNGHDVLSASADIHHIDCGDPSPSD